MKTIKKILLLSMCFILVASLLTGCAPKKPAGIVTKPTLKTESMKLFFPLKDNSKLGNENHNITFEKDKDKLKNLIEELVKGPKDLTYGVAVNPGTKLNSAVINGSQATLDFSKEFKGFGGVMDEAAKLAAIVDTALEISGLTEVKITVDGKEIVALSGMPYGFLKYIDFNTESSFVTREVKLYFANADSDGVIVEKRNINVAEGIKIEVLYKKIVQELISGPSEKTLFKTIPPEAKILRLQVDGEIVTVDFSKEMLTKHWRGTSGETMTLASIVNTLTEFPEVKRVMLLVEGKPMNIDSVIVDKPLTRMENIIKK